MNLWFDMTYSLITWQGGMIGIVRAELEIARNLKICDPNLKISVFKNGKFLEVPETELQWLWNAESVGDAYIEHFGRKKKVDVEVKIQEPDALRSVKRPDEGRLGRIYRAEEIFINNAKTPAKQLLRGTFFVGNCFLSVASKIHMSHKRKKECDLRENMDIDDRMTRFQYPYKEGDIILSAGWYGTDKEEVFSKIKGQLHGLKLVYLIYDLVLVHEDTQALYGQREQFTKYLYWISANCDFVLFGGKTAQEDAEKFWREHNKNVPEGCYIKFGSEVSNIQNPESIENVRKKYNLERDYVLTIGTVDAKKNQDVLYRAYTLLARKYAKEEYPQLVIVGGKAGEKRLIKNIEQDPLVRDKVIIIQPTDSELVTIYQNCKFTLLPSLYEGWSLTLPESLNYNKFCIASDVRPLHEVGEDFCKYVDPYNPKQWAEEIMYYYMHEEVLSQCENHILKDRKNITWKNCTVNIYNILNEFRDKYEKTPIIYYDLTTALWLCITDENVSGILRTELLLARKLYARWNKIQFFAFYQGSYLAINKQDISEILDESIEIDLAYKKNKYQLQKIVQPFHRERNKNNREAYILLFSVLPQKIQNILLKKRTNKVYEKQSYDKLKLPFSANDVVFSAGTGFSGEEEYNQILKEKERLGFQFCQLIYDFTPILVPQTHRQETIENYEIFLKWTYKLADVVYYGGQTALEDGKNYAIEHHLEQRMGKVIRFGSDVAPYKDKEIKEKKIKKTFKKYGITQPFILAVGTIQPRKNYDTLYLAYINWLAEKPVEAVPQLVFAGYPGWNTEEFLAQVDRDDRVKGKLIICTPDDKELEILYRQCKFTLLASLYEGWSLTLPQSLNYGKFCIAANVRPLRETGKNFVDYVEPLDIIGWKDKMEFYSEHDEILTEREKNIRENWHNISWDECADQLMKDLLGTEKKDK